MNFSDANVVQTWVVVIGALCTLGIYSILYRENVVYRFFEHLFLGLAAGYALYIAWHDTLGPKWWIPMTQGGQWWWAFALPAGLLFYTIYSKRHAWMSRLIFGLFFGIAVGQALQAFAAKYFPLIRSAIIPVFNTPESKAPNADLLTTIAASANNILFIVILIAVMSYFFFSFEQKNVLVTRTSRFGRYVLMVAFGAIFANTMMARMSLLIERIYFLLHDFIQVTIFRQAP